MHPLSKGRRWLLATASAAVVALAGAGAAQAATQTTLAPNMTFPLGGLVLKGANGSTHYWTPDHINGVCRVDATGLNQGSCVLFVSGSALKPGQLSYDPATNYIYVPDLSAKSLGVVRLKYDPTADSGNGGISIFDRTVLAPGCGIAGNLPWGSALGPDGNLYLSFKKTSSIVRLKTPSAQTTIPCSSVQTMGTAGDGKKSFALAFVGTTLGETNNNGVGVIGNATQCATPGFGTCNSSEVVVGTIAGPYGITGDATTNSFWVGGLNGVYRFGLNGSVALYQSEPAQVVGLTIDPDPLTRSATGVPTLYGSMDSTGGLVPNSGTIFRLDP
jgi:hypothetical protein